MAPAVRAAPRPKMQQLVVTVCVLIAAGFGWRHHAMSVSGALAAQNQQESAMKPDNVGIEPSGVGTNYRQRGKRDRLLAMRACLRDELIIKRCVNHIVLKKTKAKDG